MLIEITDEQRNDLTVVLKNKAVKSKASRKEVLDYFSDMLDKTFVDLLNAAEEIRSGG